MIKGIFINAGHGLGPTGGIDNGASGFGTTERKEIVEVAQELFDRVRADMAFNGIESVKIGVDDRMMLKDMIKEINDVCRNRGWGRDDAVVVSIHANAAGDPAARGVEAWYGSQKPGGDNLSRIMVERVCASTGIPPRTRPARISSENRWGRLGILDDTIPLGCLVEIGFITNEFDAQMFKDTQMDDKFAQGLHEGLRAWMALPTVPNAAPPPDFFRDIADSAWYAGDVRACFEAGLFRMPPDGLFRPERPVTRAELATVMGRLLSRITPPSGPGL